MKLRYNIQQVTRIILVVIFMALLRQFSCFDPNTIKTCENIKVKHDDVSKDKNKVTTDCSLFFYDLEDVGCDSKSSSRCNNFLVSENKWHSEPLTWCGLLMIDHVHKLRGFYYSLRQCKESVFKYEKGCPEVDRYANVFRQKYGTTIASVKLMKSGIRRDAFLTINNSLGEANSTRSSARSSAKLLANTETTQFNDKSTSKNPALVGRNGTSNGGKSAKSSLSLISATNCVSILKFGKMDGNASINILDDFHSYNYNYNYNYSGMTDNYAR